jgi:uncharacterized membrane protein
MDDILSLLQDFDVANFLPEPEQFIRQLEGWTRFFVLLGPLVLLGLGACYYFKPPKESNHDFGFRSYWGMGSVQAWQYAQHLSGLLYMIAGGALTVLMGIISLFFRGESAFSMITTAVICVVIELLIVLALWIFLQFVLYRTYDKDGNPRRR